MLARFSNWLYEAPVPDPVDRRNAWFMQMLFMFVGVAIPLNKLYVATYSSSFARLFIGDTFSYARIAAGVDIGTDVAMATAAWYGLWLIRQGQFRLAISRFLYVVLGSALLAYATFGYWAVFGDLIPVMCIALGGLMIGRRALWLIYIAVMLEFLVGMGSDMLRHSQTLHAAMHESNLRNDFVDFPSRAMSYLLVVLILDRSSDALREGLRDSERHRLRLQAEIREREDAQEALLHARKMDAVGQLASGVAHDFNNVLGIIMGFTRERHRLDEPDSPRANEDTRALARALEGIETASRRGASISRKLLNFSRRDTTHSEIFDLHESVRELKPMLQQLLPLPMTVKIETSDEPLLIHFDRSQLELALLNLASNARDAMPDGGMLTIATHAQDGRAILTVSDTGSGMNEAVRLRIFEPFFTTKPVNRGTGLGLSVVFGLFKRGGGDIRVQSAPGKGTRFVIQLPRASSDRNQAGTEALNLTQAIRVLLIDADGELLQLLSERLRTGGCLVSAAASAEEAEQFAWQTPAPDVIVCDGHLPDSDEASLIGRMRLRLRGVPLILTSAARRLHESEFGSVDASTEYLPKPFLPDQLLARVLAAANRETVNRERLIQVAR